MGNTPGTGGMPPAPAGYQSPDLPGVAAGSSPRRAAPTLSGLGGIRLFAQATAPTQPPVIPVDSIWVNTANPNNISFNLWNGAAWVVQAFAGNQLITAGTIVANLIAAGTIVAGIVNGTEIDGGIIRALNASGATIMTINKTAATWILYADTGSVTQGPMIASGANAQVNDEFGNTALAGVAAYFGSSGAWAAVVLSSSGGSGAALAWFFSSNAVQTAWTVQASFQNAVSGTLLMGNGGFGFTVAANDQFAIHSGNGPFASDETGWHAVSLPGTGGFSGTIRVKKLPWNAIWLDVQVRWTGTTGTTYTCGALPDASYYPTTGTPRVFNIAYGDTPNSDLLGNIVVPASGALSIFTNSSSSGSGTAGWYGCSVMYPTN